MRYPSDDTADQPARRRRGHGSDQQPDGQKRDEASVFVPGYAGRGDPGQGPASGSQASAGGTSAGHQRWHGSSAGKGPVRGYPPLPGQPPPVYPPGQFAAWNRRGPGQARHAAEGIAADVGRAAAPPADGGRGDGSGYYAADADPHTEPGYSMLAVSDPAADVTSTQTWQAPGDGLATGTWTAPARPASPRPASRLPAGLDDPGRGPGTGGSRAVPGWPGTAPEAERADRARVSGGHRGIGAGTASPGPAAGAPDAPGQAAPVAEPGRAGRSRSGRRSTAGRGKSTRSTRLVVASALAIALVGGTAAYLGAEALARKPRPQPRAATTPKVTPAASASVSPTPSLGPYGYIASRRDDPTPLTVAELYPVSFSAGGTSFARTRSKISADCVDAVDGAGIQAAVSSAGCTQVARATYLASSTGMMGTIGVLNLKTAKSASAAARAAGAGNFIAQLTGRTAPTSKIGQGTGIEEALAKGHYLILIWAELASRKAPHKGAQRTSLDSFMTELLENTANVSLTNRMVNGSPSPAVSGA